MPDYVVPVDVRFADLDALGHVNSTRILSYAEHARVNWLLGHGGAESASRLPIILASAHVDYKAPIPMSAALDVAMWVSKVGTKSWDFDYEVRDRGGRTVYAAIRTVQVAYDYGAKRSVPIDDRLRAKLDALQRPAA